MRFNGEILAPSARELSFDGEAWPGAGELTHLVEVARGMKRPNGTPAFPGLDGIEELSLAADGLRARLKWHGIRASAKVLIHEEPG